MLGSPQLFRSQDFFLALVAVMCGAILFFQGWRLDPILQFVQIILVIIAIYYTVESIRLRQ